MPPQMIESEKIMVIIAENGTGAIGLSVSHRNVRFKIQEVMLGSGSHRKPVPWTKFFISPKAECNAEILENGKLRIV